MASDVARRLRTLMASALGRRHSDTRAITPAPALVELARSGPAPLSPDRPDPRAPLSIATVIPSFRRGSGGHGTIVRLLHGLRAQGHEISLWLEDGEGRHAEEPAAVTKRSFDEFFAAEGLELHTGFEAWRGADVVLATGWQTVARVLMLPSAGARAYLVQDHEPDFYGASAERLWAVQTYRLGLHCIAASPWLAELLRTRYKADATHFDLAVDRKLYRPEATGRGDEDRERRRGQDLVVFYARAVTPRRAVPLGLLALSELSRRRPDVQIGLYGEDNPLAVPFEHRHLGVLDERRLAELYSQATVGMVLSLTNPSLIGLEMMACGLPCVELASESMLATFGADGPLQLAEPDPLALCAALERLLDEPERRNRASEAGFKLMAERTWEHAVGQVEEGLQVALTEQQAQV
ncbi:MAG TPA: glycosyltransferase family 4 protein [Solirubrobacteraceae bacterium]|nr:glycosyltransferase family 4 protein [Solirubrobacteraceae bacterium]